MGYHLLAHADPGTVFLVAGLGPSVPVLGRLQSQDRGLASLRGSLRLAAGLGSSFARLSVARQWVTDFVQWYNQEHRHNAIGFVAPGQRHAGLDKTLLRNRTKVYEAAKRRCPQRGSGPGTRPAASLGLPRRPAPGATRNWQRVAVVHLNPDQHDTAIRRQRQINQDDNKAV